MVIFRVARRERCRPTGNSTTKTAETMSYLYSLDLEDVDPISLAIDDDLDDDDFDDDDFDDEDWDEEDLDDEDLDDEDWDDDLDEDDDFYDEEEDDYY